MTPRQIEKWENTGKADSTWPRLAAQARGAPRIRYWVSEPVTNRAPERTPTITRQGYGTCCGALIVGLADIIGNPPRCGRAVVEQSGSDYSGPMSFSSERFADYLARHDIPWPRMRLAS